MAFSQPSDITTDATQRLFFALWPDGGVRERLDAAAAAVARDSGRRVPRGNLHLTLVFLGQTPAGRRDCMVQAAAAIRCPAFELRLDRCGHFRRTRIAWLGPAAPPPALVELHRQLNTALADCGGTPETRPFAPHVTLARKAGRCRTPAGFTPIDWAVRSFALVKSPGDGSGYRVLATWPLTAA
ncbi:MAG TPA: RNA 2',3'-cyclic phosphodiesterase [Thiohalobacter sp.]|nr:RNA 2',3'-cyclic phosphodiesterase [Thiohalobacter sp.]